VKGTEKNEESPEDLYSRVIKQNFKSHYCTIKKACEGVDFGEEELPQLSEVSFSTEVTHSEKRNKVAAPVCIATTCA